MQTTRIDITGQRFGRLIVLKYAYTKNKKAYWLCKCDCGNEKIVKGISLKKGLTKSCGCLRKEKITRKNTTHNLTHTRLYRIWCGMKKRILNQNAFGFNLYGGRGIKICTEWENNFFNFYNWAINNGYKEGLTLDRIDINGNYEPSNCRWATPKEQGRNKRNNHLITFNGETHCIVEWAEILNFKIGTLSRRLRLWDIEKALSTPKLRTHKTT